MSKFKPWLLEPRPAFLLLSVLLISLGTSVAVYEGYFNPLHFLLAMAGMLLVHVSCNVLNDYFDYKSGLDLQTQRTPFSGGSGILPAKLLKPESVYRLGVACFFLASLIGVYFMTIWGWLLLPILVIGGISTYFYSTHLSRWMVGEFFAGLNFGPLAILGAYFVQTGGFGWGVLVASLAPGIMDANLLVLNQIPDAEADEKVGRRHVVIAHGKRRASRLYAALLLAAYLSIIVGVVSRLMPYTTLIGLASIPLALKAARSAMKNFDDAERLIPAMGANVATILTTQTLLTVGYGLATIFSL